MLADSAFALFGKSFAPAALRKMMEDGGFRLEQAYLVGVGSLIPAVLYAYPPTALLGAILLTGFLGGALCTLIRVGQGLAPPAFVVVVLGFVIWGGLYLRDPRLHALLPFG